MSWPYGYPPPPGYPPSSPVQFIPYPMGNGQPPTPETKSEYVKFLKKLLKEAKGKDGEKKKEDPKKEEKKGYDWKKLVETSFWVTFLAPFMFTFEYLVYMGLGKVLGKLTGAN